MSPCHLVNASSSEPDADQAHRIYTFFLRWCDKPGAGNYLTRRRGISLATVQRMGIVFLPADVRKVEDLLRREFGEDELAGAGLWGEWGLIFRRYPLLIPFAWRGRIRFLQGRRLDGREPKYLSAHRPIPCLYNQDVLDTLAPGAPVALCEGVLDTLTLLDQGVAAVGILGVGTFKPEWMDALRPFRVLLCLDSDVPGQRAAHALRARMAAAGLDPHLVALPEGVKDVNQLFTERPDLVSEWAALRET